MAVFIVFDPNTFKKDSCEPGTVVEDVSYPVLQFGLHHPALGGGEAVEHVHEGNTCQF